MTDQDEPLPLPGLDVPSRPELIPPLVVATRRTLAALQASGHLQERHALTCQLMLDLADVVATSSRHGKASAAAMAAAQLLAAQELILSGAEIDRDARDPWEELAREIEREATRERAEQADRA